MVPGRPRPASARVYYLVYLALIVCTFLTVQIAFFDLGELNTVAALGIAAIKASLVVVYFMHAKDSSGLTWAVAVSGIFWLAILLALTLTDYATRGWLTYG